MNDDTDKVRSEFISSITSKDKEGFWGDMTAKFGDLRRFKRTSRMWRHDVFKQMNYEPHDAQCKFHNAYPWIEEDFLCCLRQRTCIGMVAEYDGTIVGFMIYELHRSKLCIINFAVDPAQQRRGVGRQMIRRLMEKLAQTHRKEIVLNVHEGNLSVQMFFKAVGFRAVGILHGFYEDIPEEDAYTMLYRLDEPPNAFKNRIEEFYA